MGRKLHLLGSPARNHHFTRRDYLEILCDALKIFNSVLGVKERGSARKTKEEAILWRSASSQRKGAKFQELSIIRAFEYIKRNLCLDSSPVLVLGRVGCVLLFLFCACICPKYLIGLPRVCVCWTARCLCRGWR